MKINNIHTLKEYVLCSYYRKLRKKDASKYHIQLSLAMLFMLSVSLALVALSVQGKTDPYGGCVMVSILVHYFILVAVMWMGAEALLMFQKLVIIFTRVTTKFMVYVSIICWSKYDIILSMEVSVRIVNTDLYYIYFFQLYQSCLSLSLSLWIWLLETVLQMTSLFTDQIVQKMSPCEFIMK